MAMKERMLVWEGAMIVSTSTKMRRMANAFETKANGEEGKNAIVGTTHECNCHSLGITRAKTQKSQTVKKVKSQGQSG